MAEYQINLAGVETFRDFVAAWNAGMIESFGARWNGNLDAFNDYFYWPEPHPYRVVLIGWEHCAAILAKLPAPDGRMMLPNIEEIFAENPQAIVAFA